MFHCISEDFSEAHDFKPCYLIQETEFVWNICQTEIL